MFDCPHCGDTHHVNDFCATGPMSQQTAPSNANTSGLEVVRLEAQSGGPSGSWFLINDPDDVAFWEEQGYPVRSLVTAASAQARIADLEARVEYLRGSRDGHAAHAHSEFEARVAAEARADRLAEIASKLDAAISWLDYPFIDNRTAEPELRSRVGFMMKDAEPYRAALQQETQP